MPNYKIKQLVSLIGKNTAMQIFNFFHEKRYIIANCCLLNRVVKYECFEQSFLLNCKEIEKVATLIHEILFKNKMQLLKEHTFELDQTQFLVYVSLYKFNAQPYLEQLNNL
jgi:hypothetical protein